jgi:hypothetical protein
MYKVGAHLVADMRQYLRSEGEAVPGVEREEFTAACARLRVAGYQVRDGDAAWTRFSELRSTYAEWLNQTTKALSIPPAPWIGDRSYLPHRERAPRSRRRAP